MANIPVRVLGHPVKLTKNTNQFKNKNKLNIKKKKNIKKLKKANIYITYIIYIYILFGTKNLNGFAVYGPKGIITHKDYFLTVILRLC